VDDAQTKRVSLSSNQMKERDTEHTKWILTLMNEWNAISQSEEVKEKGGLKGFFLKKKQITQTKS
jgi:hypothetical protein